MPAPIWLAHHTGDATRERCVHWRGLSVCRRCLALWPFVLAAILTQVVMVAPGYGERDLLAAVVLTPAVIEYVRVHGLGTPYRAAHIWLVTPFAGLALGRLLYRHMVHPFDPLAWSIMGLAALPTGWALWRYHSRSSQ